MHSEPLPPTVMGGTLVRESAYSDPKISTAVGEEHGIDFGLNSVELLMEGSCAIQLGLADQAVVDMLLYDFFFIEGQLPIQHQWELLGDGIAVHTKSPRAARIFCVARNKQFLAASSVVPRTPPIALRRIPW